MTWEQTKDAALYTAFALYTLAVLTVGLTVGNLERTRDGVSKDDEIRALRDGMARCEVVAARAVRYAESVQHTTALWLTPKPWPRVPLETREVEP